MYNAQQQKLDMRYKSSSLGADEVRQQRLATFTLKGDTCKLWDKIQTDEQKVRVAWVEFEATFDQQCITRPCMTQEERVDEFGEGQLIYFRV